MGDKRHPYYPFDCGYADGRALMAISTEAQLHRVRGFDALQCEAALSNRRLHLKKTVRQALLRRRRKLQR